MKHTITDTWYVVQVFQGGEWLDSHDQDCTLKEAKSEMRANKRFGDKMRIIERVSAFKVVKLK